jgi:hypothetical protein
MARVWVACGNDFQIGDVLRWTERVWYKSKRRRKAKPMAVAQQEVTGQMLRLDRNGFVYFEVMKCESGESHFAMGIEPLKKKDIIKRKRTTIARGGAEKLVQIDPPKPKVKSRFLG